MRSSRFGNRSRRKIRRRLSYLRAPNDFTYDIQLEAHLQHGEDGFAARHHANEFPQSLLEHRATTRASHRRRLQSSAGRFARQRNDQRTDRRIARLHVGTDLARRESAHACRMAKRANGWKTAIASNDHRLAAEATVIAVGFGEVTGGKISCSTRAK